MLSISRRRVYPVHFSLCPSVLTDLAAAHIKMDLSLPWSFTMGAKDLTSLY